MKELSNVWLEGFQAGQRFGSRCPYPKESAEAETWENGWAEGVLKRTGENYRDEPPPKGWRKLLELFTGR